VALGAGIGIGYGIWNDSSGPAAPTTVAPTTTSLPSEESYKNVAIFCKKFSNF